MGRGKQEGGKKGVLVRVSEDLRDRVQKIALREDRPIGKQIERLLEEPLAKAEAQGKEAHASR